MRFTNVCRAGGLDIGKRWATAVCPPTSRPPPGPSTARPALGALHHRPSVRDEGNSPTHPTPRRPATAPRSEAAATRRAWGGRDGAPQPREAGAGQAPGRGRGREGSAARPRSRPHLRGPQRLLRKCPGCLSNRRRKSRLRAAHWLGAPGRLVLLAEGWPRGAGGGALLGLIGAASLGPASLRPRRVLGRAVGAGL